MELKLSPQNADPYETGTWLEPEDAERLASRDMQQLEELLCEYVGAEHCVCVNSATTGMLLALKAAGVEMGDTVLCTSFSYFAISEIIELAGAKPMFVDINPNTYCIDAYCLEYVIGKCKRQKRPIPKILIAVDLFGLPCNYEALEEICSKHNILLIEDMSESFGATFQGKRTGTFGTMAVASFFPAKPLDEQGEGGAIFCHNKMDACRLRALRRQLQINRISDGGHLGSVQASIVKETLLRFDENLERRRKLCQQYRKHLEGHVRLQLVGEEYQSACTQFVISLHNTRIREEMMETLLEKQIPCQVFQPTYCFRSRQEPSDRVALVNAQSVAQRLLAIPMHPYLSNRVVDYICECILEQLGISSPQDTSEESPAQQAESAG